MGSSHPHPHRRRRSRPILNSALALDLSLIVIVIVILSLLLLWTPLTHNRVEGACPPGTWNDGYVTFTSSNAFLIANPDVNVGDGSFTIEAWIRRSRLSTENEFWMAVGVNADKTSNKYLHLGWRSATQGFTFAFWSNDYDYTGTSTLGITKDLNWHHWAYRYTVSGGSRIRQVFIDGVVHGPNSASGDLNSPAGKPWHLGGRADNGLENKFEGDLDELMYFNTALPDSVIQSHALGYYNGTVSPLQQSCKMWFKFNEQSGKVANDSCTQNVRNAAKWDTGTESWKTANDNPKCLPSYFDSFVVSGPLVGRVGSQIPLTIQTGDQWRRVWLQDVPSSLTISIKSKQSTSNIGSFTPVALSYGQGTISMVTDTPGSYTFALSDTSGIGKSVDIISPTVTVYQPDLVSVTFTNLLGDTILPLTPSYTPSRYSYTVQSVYYGISAIGLKATFAQNVVLFVNGLPSGALPLDANAITPITLNYGVNLIQLQSSETIDSSVYTYTYSITRLSPDLRNITFTTVPALLSQSVPFIGGDTTTTTRVIDIPGLVQSVSVRLDFSVSNTTTIQLNGQTHIGPIVSGVDTSLVGPFIEGDNFLIISSTIDNMVYRYRLTTGCPRQFQCRSVPGQTIRNQENTPILAERECSYCMGNRYRNVKHLERPACCGEIGCQC